MSLCHIESLNETVSVTHRVSRLSRWRDTLWGTHARLIESRLYESPSMSPAWDRGTRIESRVYLERERSHESYVSTHGGDQTWNILIFRSAGFPSHSFEWQGLPLTPLKPCLKIFWTPVRSCLKVTGTPVTCWLFSSRNYFKSDLLHLWSQIEMLGPRHEYYMHTCTHTHIYIYEYVYSSLWKIRLEDMTHSSSLGLEMEMSRWRRIMCLVSRHGHGSWTSGDEIDESCALFPDMEPVPGFWIFTNAQMSHMCHDSWHNIHLRKRVMTHMCSSTEMRHDSFVMTHFHLMTHIIWLMAYDSWLISERWKRVMTHMCLCDSKQKRVETWGAGVETQENKNIFVPLSKKDKKKNLMSVGRIHLLHHCWYKVSELHISKYHLMSVW